MDLIPHKNWRVTQNIHVSHAPSNEQWIMLDKWFDLHLKKEKTRIPATPSSNLETNDNQAVFTITPENKMNDLKEVEVYYSYDPNSITRFWKTALATNQNGTWTAQIEHKPQVPFYVHAICRYSNGSEGTSLNGNTSTYVINSLSHSIIPKHFDYKELSKLAKDTKIFEDFSNGI